MPIGSSAAIQFAAEDPTLQSTIMNTLPDYKTWTYFRHDKPVKLESTSFNKLERECYAKSINGVEWSCGVFTLNSNPIMMAWGIRAEPHCSYHAIMQPNGQWTEPIEGCPLPQQISETEIAFRLPGSDALVHFSSVK